MFYIDTIEYEMSAEKIDEEYKPYSFISDNGITYTFSNYPDNRIIFWNKNDKTYIDISDKLDPNNEMYLYWNYIRKDNKFMCIPCDRDDLLVTDMLEKKMRSIYQLMNLLKRIPVIRCTLSIKNIRVVFIFSQVVQMVC